MSGPISITVDLDIDRWLAPTVKGYTEDGDPIGAEPQTLEGVVLDLVVEKLVNQVVSKATKDDYYNRLRDKVSAIRDEIIAERLGPVIDEALNGETQRTDEWGAPKGDPTTLRAEIAKQINDWTKNVHGDQYRNTKRLTNLQVIVAAEVDKAMAKECKEAITAARAEVTAAVQEKGSKILAETITAMAGKS